MLEGHVAIRQPDNTLPYLLHLVNLRVAAGGANESLMGVVSTGVELYNSCTLPMSECLWQKNPHTY